MVKLAKCQIEIQYIRAAGIDAILFTSTTLFQIFTLNCDDNNENQFPICPDFERDLSQREIRSILLLQLVMLKLLIDESGDL